MARKETGKRPKLKLNTAIVHELPEVEQAEAVALLHRHLVAAKRFPHEGQAQIIRAVFNDKVKMLQVQCARNAGKTDACLYLAWRYAATHPNAIVWIICPQLNQAKKIYWLSKRLQTYGPRALLHPGKNAYSNTNFAINFQNGAMVMVDGCENYDSLRGVKPQFVIYDEFQNHTEEFDTEVMQPNLSSGNVTLVAVGTPPKRKCYYSVFKDNLLHKVIRRDKSCRYIEFPIWKNPLIDKKWLRAKKEELVRNRKENLWLREYEGKDAFDEEGAIIPTFDPKAHLARLQTINKIIGEDAGKWKYYAAFDPASSSTFAVLFIAWNIYSGKVVFLDEIYEKQRALMTTSAIWDRARAIKEGWMPDMGRWTNIYDCAAAWFANEVRSQFGELEAVNLIPAGKYSKNVSYNEAARPGESMLIELFGLPGRAKVNDKMANFVMEMANYVRDDQGRYPKNLDHLVDCMHYWVVESGFKTRKAQDEEVKFQNWINSQQGMSLERWYAIKKAKNNPLSSYEVADDIYDSSMENAGDDLWN